MCSAGDKVTLTRDAAFLQGLVEQVGLAWGDDSVGRAVHQEHRGARLADVVDGVGRLGCLLVGEDASLLGTAVADMVSGRWKTASIPDRWDGRSAERIVQILLEQ